MRITVTGATGFIGRAVVEALLEQNFSVTALVRQYSKILPDNVQQIELKNLRTDLSSSEWTEARSSIKQALQGTDTVIHLAGRAHKTKDKSLVAANKYKKINEEYPLEIAKLASELGVRRFIFLSSIGVNGNNNQRPFTENDTPHPQELYAKSKLKAEQDLFALGKTTKIDIVIIRSPLVYGPNPPGNFSSLIKLVNTTVPLPLGAVHNKRSIVALENLVDFILLCTKHPQAANEIFLISDGEDISTTELLQKVASAYGKTKYLIPVPVTWMRLLLKVIGKDEMAQRIFDSLQVDTSKAQRLLDWKPVITIEKQLEKVAFIDSAGKYS